MKKTIIFWRKKKGISNKASILQKPKKVKCLIQTLEDNDGECVHELFAIPLKEEEDYLQQAIKEEDEKAKMKEVPIKKDVRKRGIKLRI